MIKWVIGSKTHDDNIDSKLMVGSLSIELKKYFFRFSFIVIASISMYHI